MILKQGCGNIKLWWGADCKYDLKIQSILRQTNLARTIDLATECERYDACAKKILTYKAIAAWILKSCTKEFSQYSVKYICDKCLKEDMEISRHAVHLDQLNEDEKLSGEERIETLNSEATAIKDQTIYYDIRFGAYVPKRTERIRLVINLEIQLNDTPGYPLVSRGFYYCARMISEQYGTVFSANHYEKLQKVYSIWICPSPAKKRKNGILRYYTVQECVAGKAVGARENFDLMEVVVINLGDADEKSDFEVLNLLNLLFSSSVSPGEKKKRLQEEFDIAMTKELESEVQDMCNLSEALVEQGIAEGAEREKQFVARMMIEENEPLGKIERYTGYAVDKLKDIAAAMGKTITV